MNRRFLHVHPSELKFPFQLHKLSTCWIELTNKIDHNVAFKVKTTHPKKYCVRPNVGLISPGSTCVIKVSMQAQKDSPATLPKDKFLVQSVIAPIGFNADNVSSEMFRKDKGNDVEELKLRVSFITVDPPSPIPEVSEDDFSPEAPDEHNPYRRNRIMDLFEAATSAVEFQAQFFKESGPHREVEEEIFEEAASTFESELQLPQEWDRVSKLIEERSLLMLENQELQYQVETIRRKMYRSKSKGNVVFQLALACFLGFAAGYVLQQPSSVP